MRDFLTIAGARLALPAQKSSQRANTQRDLYIKLVKVLVNPKLLKRHTERHQKNIRARGVDVLYGVCQPIKPVRGASYPESGNFHLDRSGRFFGRSWCSAQQIDRFTPFRGFGH